MQHSEIECKLYIPPNVSVTGPFLEAWKTVSKCVLNEHGHLKLISRVPMDWKPASPPFAASMYILPMPL